jgi:hypothetical protein
MRVGMLVVLVCLLCALPAQASGVWFLVRADSLGATIIDVEEYRAVYLPDSATTSLARSGLMAEAVFMEAVRHQPSHRSSEEMERMIESGEWTVIIDLAGVLNRQEQAFTNVAEEGFACPRTFISGEVLSDTSRSLCEQIGLVGHEWRHACDFVDGLAPAYFATATETSSFDQDIDLLEFEYRGYHDHMRALMSGTCLTDNPFGRAWARGGAYELRRMIADVYGLYRRHPQQHRRIDALCRWSSAEQYANTAP